MKLLLLIATALPFITCQLGGDRPYQTSLADPLVNFAIKGINNFNNANGDQRPRVGERVVSATSQIVAGTKYKFVIEVSGGDVIEVCRVIVLSQLWLDRTTILENPKCAPKV